MLDHVGIGVSDYQLSKEFYEAALAPLDYQVVMEIGEIACGFGTQGKAFFWIGSQEEPGIAHVAFTSPDRATVDAFYDAAIDAGGRDNGSPGIREHYHANYYGAFVLDPEGNNIEAVCHLPEM